MQQRTLCNSLSKEVSHTEYKAFCKDFKTSLRLSCANRRRDILDLPLFLEARGRVLLIVTRVSSDSKDNQNIQYFSLLCDEKPTYVEVLS